MARASAPKPPAVAKASTTERRKGVAQLSTVAADIDASGRYAAHPYRYSGLLGSRAASRRLAAAPSVMGGGGALVSADSNSRTACRTTP
jgi:hypothetical protein